MDLTWSEVKAGSRAESGEERSPEASADFRESDSGEVDGITEPWSALGPHRSSHSSLCQGSTVEFVIKMYKLPDFYEKITPNSTTTALGSPL